MSEDSACLDDSLFKTKRVTEEESKAREKASLLKAKLVNLKRQKEEEAERAIKEMLVEHYQRKFQQFKTELQEETNSQITSLELVREFKLNEITEVEQFVHSIKAKLIKSLAENEAYERQLNQSHQAALQFLQGEEEKQCEAERGRLEKECERQIREYEQSICIE